MTNITDKTISSDSAGNTALNGIFGEQIVGTKNDDIAVQFQYSVLNEEFDVLPASTIPVTGDGIRSSADSYCEVSSATTGTAVIQSRNSIRYTPGRTFYAFFTAYFSGVGVGYAGPHDDEDGFYIRVSDTSTNTAFFGYLKDGVETGEVSIDMTDIDIEKLNIFGILGGYLGVANPTLLLRKGGVWSAVATIDVEGLIDETHVNNPVFPIRIKAEDGMVVRSGSWEGGTIGSTESVGNRAFSFPNSQIVAGAAASLGEVTLSGTNIGTLAIIHLKDTFQGKTNKVKARLLNYSFVVNTPGDNESGDVTFQIVGNPTLSGTPTYLDINSNSSTVEIDSLATAGASVDATLGTPLVTTNTSYSGAKQGGDSGRVSIDAEKIGAVGYPGDVFAIVCKDKAGNNISVSFEITWEELF